MSSEARPPRRRYRKKKNGGANTAASSAVVDENNDNDNDDDDEECKETGFMSITKNGKITGEGKAMEKALNPPTAKTTQTKELKNVLKEKRSKRSVEDKKKLKKAAEDDYRPQAEYAAVVAAMNSASKTNAGSGSLGREFGPSILLDDTPKEDDVQAFAAYTTAKTFSDDIKTAIKDALGANANESLTSPLSILIAEASKDPEQVAVVASLVPASTGVLTTDLKTTSEIEITVDVSHTVADTEKNLPVDKYRPVDTKEGYEIPIPESAIKRQLRPYFGGVLPESFSDCRAMIKSVHIQNTFNSLLYGGGNTHIGVKALSPSRGRMMVGTFDFDLLTFQKNLNRPAFAHLLRDTRKKPDEDETILAWREQLNDIALAKAKIQLDSKDAKQKQPPNPGKGKKQLIYTKDGGTGRALKALIESYETVTRQLEAAISKRLAKLRKENSEPTPPQPKEKPLEFFGVSQADVPDIKSAISREAGLRRVWELVNPPNSGEDATCKCLYKNDVMEVLRSGGAELNDFQAMSAWARTNWQRELHLEMYRFLTAPNETRCKEIKSENALSLAMAEKTGEVTHDEAVSTKQPIKATKELSEAYKNYCVQLPVGDAPIVLAMKDPSDADRKRWRENPLALFAVLMAPAIIHSTLNGNVSDDAIAPFVDVQNGVLRLPRKTLYEKLRELAHLHQLDDTILPLDKLSLLLLPQENAFVPPSVNKAKEPFAATRGFFKTQAKIRLIMVEPTISSDLITRLKDSAAMQSARVGASLTAQLKNVSAETKKDVKEQQQTDNKSAVTKAVTAAAKAETQVVKEEAVVKSTAAVATAAASTAAAATPR